MFTEMLEKARQNAEECVSRIEAREYAISAEWLETYRSPLRPLGVLHLAAVFSNDLRLITADKAFAESAKPFGVRHKLIA